MEQYLVRYLGDYIAGLDKQNLSVSTWRGQIHLRSARLKQEAVELLNLPFQLIYGEIGDLKVNVSWTFLGSRPVVVELERLRLLLGPKPVAEWSEEEERRRVQLHRQKRIDQTDLLCGLKEGCGAGEPSQGFLSRLVTRINDNVELHLRGLHIRFEDQVPVAGGSPFYVGAHLPSLQVQTAGADWNPTFIDRSRELVPHLFKLLTLHDLSAYYVPPEWAAGTADPTAASADALAARFGSDSLAALARQGRIAYVLQPFSGRLQLTQSLNVTDTTTPRFGLSCNLDPLKVNICHGSYEGLCGIMALVSEYFAFQEVIRHRIDTYWPHRPSVPLRGHARQWWQYAARCVCIGPPAPEQTRRKAVTFASLITPENLARLRVQGEYCDLLRRHKASQLGAEQEQRLQFLDGSLQLTDILRWRASTLERWLQEKPAQDMPQQEPTREAPLPSPSERRGWSLWFAPGARLEKRTDAEKLAAEAQDSTLPARVTAAREDARTTAVVYDNEGDSVPILQTPSEVSKLHGESVQQTPPCSQEGGSTEFIHLPSVGSWLCKHSKLQGRPESRTPATTPTAACSVTSDGSRGQVEGMPVVAGRSSPRSVPSQSAVQASLDGKVCTVNGMRTTFTTLPSVGSWLIPRPLSCDDHHAPHQQLQARPDFRLLPSVGTWLSTRPHKVAEEPPPAPAPGGLLSTLRAWLFPGRATAPSQAPKVQVLPATPLPEPKGAAESQGWFFGRRASMKREPGAGDGAPPAADSAASAPGDAVHAAPVPGEAQPAGTKASKLSAQPIAGDAPQQAAHVEQAIPTAGGSSAAAAGHEPATAPEGAATDAAPPRSWLAWASRGSLAASGGKPPGDLPPVEQQRAAPAAPKEPPSAPAPRSSWGWPFASRVSAAPAAEQGSVASAAEPTPLPRNKPPDGGATARGGSQAGAAAGLAGAAKAGPALPEPDPQPEQPDPQPEASPQRSASPRQQEPGATPGRRGWRGWLSPGAAQPGHADFVTLRPEPEDEPDSSARPGLASFMSQHPIDAPLLRLSVAIPEVLVQLSLREQAFAVGAARRVLLKCDAGDELHTSAEVADVELKSQWQAGKRQRMVETRLVYLDPCTRCRDGQDAVQVSTPVFIGYESRDSNGQPWVSIQGSRLVLFYQQELFAEIAHFLAAPKQATMDIARKGGRRGLDRWQRRAKALLYSRGRPRVRLVLSDNTIVVPTRALRPAGVLVDAPVLAFRSSVLRAESTQVVANTDHYGNSHKVACLPGGAGGSIMGQDDLWNLRLKQVQIVHFASRSAFLAGHDADRKVTGMMDIQVECLFRKHITAHHQRNCVFGIVEPQAQSLVVEVDAKMPEFCAAFNAQTYESTIRAVRLLLRGSGSQVAAAAEATQRPAAPRAARECATEEDLRGHHAEMARRSSSYLSDISPSPSRKSRVLTRFLSCAEQDIAHADSLFRTTAEEDGRHLEKSPSRRPLRFDSLLSRQDSDEAGMSSPETVDASGSPTGGQHCAEMARPRLQIALSAEFVSIRFHCLPDPEDRLELSCPRSVFSFTSHAEHCSLGFKMGSLMLVQPSLSRQCPDAQLLLAESPGNHDPLSVSITFASDLEARAAHCETAEMKIALDLGRVRSNFTPRLFRDFISFAKSTPAVDPVVAAASQASRPDGCLPVYRICWSIAEGTVTWVEDSTSAHFAESRFARSEFLLDLHQETVHFFAKLANFTIEDRSSKSQPSILAPKAGAEYHLEVSARTFMQNTPEFKGYNTLVNVSLANVHLFYFGQKFMRCWTWIFKSFLPAVTTSGRQQDEPTAEESEGESEDKASTGSFLSCPDVSETASMPSLNHVSRVESPIDGANEVEARALWGMFAEIQDGAEISKDVAWAAAAAAAQAASRWSSSASSPNPLPRLLHYEVTIDRPVVTLPLHLAGRPLEPHVHMELGQMVISNAPGRSPTRGAVDVVTLDCKGVRMLGSPGYLIFHPADFQVQIDMAMSPTLPPAPMYVWWRSSLMAVSFTSYYLALLRAVFSQNIAGVDPDVPQPATPTNEHGGAKRQDSGSWQTATAQAPKAVLLGPVDSPMTRSSSSSAPAGTPVWLIFTLTWKSVRVHFKGGDRDLPGPVYATLDTERLSVEIRKHTGPCVETSFSMKGAVLRSCTLQRPFDAVLLPGRKEPKLAAASGGRSAEKGSGSETHDQQSDAELFGKYVSDGVAGTTFKLHVQQPCITVAAVFGQLWSFLFPSQPWFPLPAGNEEVQALPSKVSVALQGASFAFAEAFDDPKSQVLLLQATLKYGLGSRAEQQRWELHMNGINLSSCHNMAAATGQVTAGQRSDGRTITENGFGLSLNVERPGRGRRCAEGTVTPVALTISDRDVHLFARCWRAQFPSTADQDAPDSSKEAAGLPSSPCSSMDRSPTASTEQPCEASEEYSKCTVPSLQVTLVSDQGSNSTPFLNIRANQSIIEQTTLACTRNAASPTSLQTGHPETTQMLETSLNVHFFNPIAAVWEPLLEAPSPDGQAGGSEMKWYQLRLHCRKLVLSRELASASEPEPEPRSAMRVRVESKDRLLLNGSDSVWRALWAHHRVWLDLARAPGVGGVAPPGRAARLTALHFAPFGIKNATGSRIRIRLPSARDAVAMFINLSNGEERRLLELPVQVAMDTAERCGRYVGVQVTLEDGTPAFDEVHHVPLDRVGQHIFPLFLPQRSLNHQVSDMSGLRRRSGRRSSSVPSLRHSRTAHPSLSKRGANEPHMPYLVCQVQTSAAHKLLVLETPLFLANLLNVPVRFAINGQEQAADIDPGGGQVAIPVTDYQHGSIVVRPASSAGAYQWSADLRLHFLVGAATPARPFRCEAARPSGAPDEAFFFYVECHCETITSASCTGCQYVIRLRPPIMLLSTLPVPVAFEISAGTGKSARRACIEPGGKEAVHVIEPETTLTLGLSVYGQDCWSERVVLKGGKPPTSGQIIVKVPLDQTRSNFMRLKLVFRSGQSPGEPLKVVVHAPSWIVDHVRLPRLRFVYSTHSKAQDTKRGRLIRSRFVKVPEPASGSQAMERDTDRLLLLDCEATQVAFQTDSSTSGAVSLGAVGSCNVWVPGPESECFDLGVYLADRMESGNLPLKVLHVMPRFVLVNQTDHVLCFHQALQARTPAIDCQPVQVQPQQRVPFHRSVPVAPCLLEARVVGNGWQLPSGKLPVEDVGEYSFQMIQDVLPCRFENISYEVRCVKATSFVIFRHENPRLAAFRFVNHTSEALSLRQHKADAPFMPLLPHSETPFGFYEPTLPKRLEVVCNAERNIISKIDLDKCNDTGKSRMPLGIGIHTTVHYEVCRKGPTLIVTFCEDQRSGVRSQRDDGTRRPPSQSSITLSLAGIGVSILAPVPRAAGPANPRSSAAAHAGVGDNSKTLKSDLLFLSIDDLYVLYKWSSTHEEVEIKMRELQLDNQREDAPHPVVLSRSGRSRAPWRSVLHRHDGVAPAGEPPGGRQHHLIFVNVQRQFIDPELLCLEHCEVQVRSMDVQLDAGFILDLRDVVQGLRAIAGSNVTPTPPQSAADPLQVDVARQGRRLYVKRLTFDVKPLILTFSGGSGLQGVRGDVGFWTRLAASMSSVDSYCLRLDPFKLSDKAVAAASLQGALQGHYYQQVLHRLKSIMGSLEVLGTLEVLGNPWGALRHFQTGCIDGFCEPYQGAMMSPEDMLEGMVKGTGSCLKNACFGASNCVWKCSSSSSQLCLLCLNNDRQHAAPLQQPRNPGEGLRLGAESCARAVVAGFIGLATAPAQGCGRGTVRGMVSELFRGVSGCLAQPIVGCLDLTRYTAEGCRNAARSGDERHRVRRPRMLYGPERVMRPYSRDDALLKELLVSVDPSLATLGLVDCVEDRAGASVAVVSDSLFLHVSKVQRRLLLKVPLRDIKDIEPQEMGQAVALNLHSDSQAGPSPLLFRVADAPTRRMVQQKLNAALDAL